MKNSLTIYVLCLACWSAALPAVAQQKRPAFDFRGIRLGDSSWTRVTLEPNCEVTDYELGEGTCTDHIDRIGEVYVRVVWAYMRGRLVSLAIVYDADDYEKIAGAFTEKFGAPHRTLHAVMRNRLNASFENEIKVWQTDSGELTVSRYGELLDAGVALITSPTGKRLLRQRSAEAQKRAAEDL